MIPITRFLDVEGLLEKIQEEVLDYGGSWMGKLRMWTNDAIDKGYRSRMIEEFQILGMAQKGYITGPSGAPFGSVGIIVNYPIAYRFL
jgi:hypothetical protein